MIEPGNVTACLVTRGDVNMHPILESLLGYREVIVWDNSIRPDWKVAGRYTAMLQASTDWIYLQDDDTIVPRSTQSALLYADGYDCVANWGHGKDPLGYDDLPLVCGGAIVSRWAAWEAIARYGELWPLDDSFKYEADFIIGTLYRVWRHEHLPFEIRDVAYNGRRLADEPWQAALKHDMTTRARAIRNVEKAA